MRSAPSLIDRALGFVRAAASNERGIRQRLPNAVFGRAPDFLIIGAQKGGTTSLYTYLCQHPRVVGASRIEVHFFDLAYDKGWWWYRSHFPVHVFRRGERIVTGEASPYYIFHPLVPERVRKDLPNVKLVAILRNPVDRAYSHYQHVRRNGREPLSFEEAIEREPPRTEGEAEIISSDDEYQSSAHRRYRTSRAVCIRSSSNDGSAIFRASSSW